MAEYDRRHSRQEEDTNTHKEALYSTRRLNKQHPNKEMSKEKLKQIMCYKCNKIGYFASECNSMHNLKTNQGNVSQRIYNAKSKPRINGAFYSNIYEQRRSE